MHAVILCTTVQEIHRTMPGFCVLLFEQVAKQQVLLRPYNSFVAGSAGTIGVSVGQSAEQQQVTFIRTASAALTTVLLNSDGWVYHDAPRIGAVVQPFDKGTSARPFNL